MQKPLQRHMKWCDRVFRYLSGTRTLGLIFGCTPEIQGGNDNHSTIIESYADADWASDKKDRKSVTGWLAQVNNDVVSWSSKKQSSVALSTCEAELYAHSSATQEVMWLQSCLSEIDCQPVKPSTIHCDNRSTLDYVKNGVCSERMKQVDIRYHFINDELNKGTINSQWISTTNQLADIFTKPLPQPQFIELRNKIMTPFSQ
jgi:hypothetical protein